MNTVVSKKPPRYKVTYRATAKEIKVSLAWVRGEIGVAEAMDMLNKESTSTTYAVFARSLKQYINQQNK